MPCSTTTLTALVLTLSISGIARAQPTLYWTDSQAGKIQSMNLADGIIQDLVTTTLQSGPKIAVDHDGGKMYWTESNSIRRANLDGTGVENLVSPFPGPPWHVTSDFTLDLKNRKMYWTTWDYWAPHHMGGVYRANLDGSNLDNLHDTGVFALALDPDAGKMYFADGLLEGEYRIRRAKMDGSDPTDLIPGAAYAIALDTRAGVLYYSVEGAIKRAKLDGSDIEILVNTGGGGLTLDLKEEKMYWTSRSRIRRANLDGSDVEDIVVASGAVFEDVFVNNPESSKSTAVMYEQPAEFNLHAAYPNPFKPSTTIQYTLGSTDQISIKVRDALGQTVGVLVDGVMPAGAHSASWIAEPDMPSGAYFYTLETERGAVTRSMVLLK